MCLGAQAPASAQPASLAECRELESVLERYACYEQLEEPAGTPARDQPATSAPAARPDPALPVVSRPADNAPATATATGSPESASAPAPSDEADADKSFLSRLWPFGKDGEESGSGQQAAPAASVPASEVDGYGLASSDARVISNDKGQRELHDTIAALEQTGYQQWQVTLAGGQVWRQMISERYRLEVGDEVRIYPSGWGDSYRLAVERLGKFIQVKRVR